MEKLLGEIPFSSEDDRDEAFYLYRNAALAIRAWKCHLLRTVRQDQAHFDALDLLDEQTVLLVNDWAMKFILQKTENPRSTGLGREGYRSTSLLRTTKLTNSFSRKRSSI